MLFRKMLRDIKAKSPQFLSIFIMAALGVGIYIGINSSWYGMHQITQEYFEENNLADVWVFDQDLSPQVRDQALAILGVSDAQLRLSFSVLVEAAHNPSLELHILGDNRISTFQLIEGKSYTADTDGLWLDVKFAHAHQIEVGDSLSLSINGMSVEKEVVGLVIAPEHVFVFSDSGVFTPDPLMRGFAFLSIQAVPQLEGIYSELLLRTDGTVETERRIEEAFVSNRGFTLNRDNHPAINLWQNELEQHRAMGTVFPLAFLAVAFLSIMTTMTRLVSSQRLEIGVLKAMGFRNRKILKHFLAYGLMMSGVGAAIGVLVFPLFLPEMMFEVNREIYSLPRWEQALSLEMVVVVMLIVLLCLGVSYLSIYKELKPVPALSLRPKAPKAMRQSLIERTRLWQQLGFSLQWNIRDVLRNRLRSLMAIVGTAGCVMLLIGGMGLRDSINEWVDWQFTHIYRFNTKLNLEETVSEAELVALLAAVDGTALIEAPIELKVNDTRHQGTLTSLNDFSLLRVVDENNQDLAVDTNGILLSRRMAALLGIGVGDAIQFRVTGSSDWKTSTVTNIFFAPAQQGIVISSEHLSDLGLNLSATSILTNATLDETLSGVKNVVTQAALRDANLEFIELINLIIGVLILAAIGLAVVVLYNLGVLSYNDKAREIATLKVIGFRSKRIKGLLLTQNILITAIGILCGIPFGYRLIDFILRTVSDSIDMKTAVSPVTLVISIAGTFTVSIIVGLFLSKRIKTLNMISALKSVE